VGVLTGNNGMNAVPMNKGIRQDKSKFTNGTSQLLAKSKMNRG